MTESDNFDLFKEFASFSLKRGVELPENLIEKLGLYWARVKEAAQFQDLTRILDDKLAFSKHFIDSFAPLYSLRKGEIFGAGDYCVDIGTGAGFPGVLLSLWNDTKDWVLVDSRLKKIQFLEKVCDELGLKNIHPYHGRAEELGHGQPHLRSNVCLITSRAIKLDEKIQAEVFRLLVKGGVLLQYVGPSAEVIKFSKKNELKFEDDIALKLHEEIENHRLLFYKK